MGVVGKKSSVKTNFGHILVKNVSFGSKKFQVLIFFFFNRIRFTVGIGLMTPPPPESCEWLFVEVGWGGRVDMNSNNHVKPNLCLISLKVRQI